MAGSMKKVLPGDPLEISADTFNTLIDVAQAHKSNHRSTSRQRQIFQTPPNIALVLNDSGADRNRFDVLGITGPILTPAENIDSFQNRVSLNGGAPGASDSGRFVILAEPIADGAIGRAYVDGVCPVRVEMDDESHGFADVSDGVTDTLLSASSGTAQLLWVQPVEDRDDPSVAWAIIRIGGGGSGGGGGSMQIVVTDHGMPYVSTLPEMPDPPGAEVDRIYSHIGRVIQGTAPFGLKYGLEDVEFYPLQRHGWFHPGAIFSIFQLGGVWVADCRNFYGIVTKSAPVGTSVPRGTVEVEPFDGNPGLVYSNPESLTRFPSSRLYRACTFPGTELQVGEPVLCAYVGAGGISPNNHDADWLATNMPNLFGDPNATDYANAEPPIPSLCITTDPDLPVAAPIDDAITSDEPVIPEVIPDP